MSKPIAIAIGTRGTFYPQLGRQSPVAATVSRVWSDNCVNLTIDGDTMAPTSVLVVQADAAERPGGYYFVPDAAVATVEAPEPFIQPKITGYRQLSPAEAALMNEGKALAEQCGAYIAKLRKHGDTARGPSSLKDSPEAPSPLLLDQRWISIGATDLQRGFMAVIRGIAQPTTF